MARSCEDDFEIVERLGSGSFGTVFKVRRKADGEFYVIKQVRIAELTYDEQVNAINEVKLLAGMDSVYVVRYFDSFLTRDSLHIVMEYCNRGDLQGLLKKAKSKSVGSLRETLIWNIGLQVMLGLYYIHKNKIVHRDLKSANIFLDKKSSDYSAKIGDLGVAKLLETSTAFAQTVIGTPYYLSPELCADQPYRDKSDCWALGVVLYECCTLRHPFDAKNQCALILKIIQSPVPAMPAKSEISKPLERMISWLLEKDPSKRPTVKMLLCEKFIQEQLAINNFEIPSELVSCPCTYTLTPEKAPIVSAKVSPSPNVQRKTNTFITTPTSTGKNLAVLPTKSCNSSKVRGDRVRGGGSRITSTAALERHQLERHNSDSKASPSPPVESYPRRHNLGIIDDDTIETMESKPPKRRPEQRNDSYDASAKNEDYNSNRKVDARVVISSPFGESKDEEEEVEEWYAEDFEEIEQNGDVDAKQAQESLAVMKLQSFRIPHDHNHRDNSNNNVSNNDVCNREENLNRKEVISDNLDDWEFDPQVLNALIKQYKDKAISILGNEIYDQVYGLCSQFMLMDIDGNDEEESKVDMEAKEMAKAASTELLHKLEKTICEHLNAGIEVACEVVFNVKLVLALESRLEEHK